MSTTVTSGHLLDSGLVARTSAVASVRDLRDDSAGGVGRVLDVRVAGGLDIEVLPDRGLDVGAAWCDGVPVSWTSPVGRGNPLDVASGTDWLSRFRGGLVVTCGTDNVGPATATSGLHGRHSGLPATDVRWDVRRDGDAVVCRITGVVEDVEMFGRRVVLRRTIETRTDRPLLVLRDSIENQGYSPTPVPVLYHVNLGAPLVYPGSTVRTGSRAVVQREDAPWVPDPALLPEVRGGPEEAVFEYLDPEAGTGEQAGLGKVVVASPVTGMVAVLRWSTASLPRLYQWVWPARDGWALGIEPSNAALFGDAQRVTGNGAPVLAVGESVDTEISVELVPAGRARP